VCVWWARAHGGVASSSGRKGGGGGLARVAGCSVGGYVPDWRGRGGVVGVSWVPVLVFVRLGGGAGWSGVSLVGLFGSPWSGIVLRLVVLCEGVRCFAAGWLLFCVGVLRLVLVLVCIVCAVVLGGVGVVVVSFVLHVVGVVGVAGAVVICVGAFSVGVGAVDVGCGGAVVAVFGVVAVIGVVSTRVSCIAGLCGYLGFVLG
jgi:hypothetical protein